MKTNLVLIGMPGSGKSTLGVLAAKMLGLNFIDTDILIQSETALSLEALIMKNGIRAFLKLEEEKLSGLKVENTLIATGGSAVYSEAAMQKLSEKSFIIQLFISLEELEKRLGNLDERGVVRKKEQSLKELFEERAALYEKWAELKVLCDKKPPYELAEEIKDKFLLLKKAFP